MLSEEYVPQGLHWPPYRATVGYALPSRQSPWVAFEERLEGYGSGANMVCRYRPRGDDGPVFRSGAVVMHPQGKLLSLAELRDYRQRAFEAAVWAVVIAVDQHNQCVEPWPC